MSQRLQVLLEEDEFRAIRRAAKARRLTVAEWVRGALREAREAEPAAAPERKLAIVRAASRHAFPTAEIDQMLAEIERGDRFETAVATAIGNSVHEAEP